LVDLGRHAAATARFFKSDFALNSSASAWAPGRVGPLHVRCPACGQLGDYHRAGGACRCGATLPAPAAYW
jgi:hypothetical protein